jgi:Bacterial CdiA-CT RNAse A domain
MARTRTSSFADTAAAQRFVQAVIDLHTLTIRDWLASDSSERLKLEGYWPAEITGRLQLRAMMYAGRGAIDVSGVRVILRRTGEHPNGFVVLSAFPVLP